MSLTPKALRFAEFILDLEERSLSSNGERLSVTPKAFRLLEVLVTSHPNVVEKEVLIQKVWPDTFVEDSNLTFNIRQLRKLLGDCKQNSIFIETVPRRGYRFISPVSAVEPEDESKTARRGPAAAPRRGRGTYFVICILLLAICVAAFALYHSKPKTAFVPGPTLTDSGKVVHAAVFPDGRQVVFAKAEEGGQSLWMRDLETGAETQVRPVENAVFTGLAVSPDGAVYFSRFAENRSIDGVSKFEGSANAEPLRSVDSDATVTFSPDGRQMAFVESQSSLGEYYVKAANIDGSGQRVLFTAKSPDRVIPTYDSSPVSWSPDGDVIACAVREENEGGSYSSLVLINAYDGTETRLSEHRWSYVDSLVWIDADHLAIIDSPIGAYGGDIWIITRSTGEAVKRTSGVEAYRSLCSSDGQLYGVATHAISGLTISSFDAEQLSLRSKQIYGEAGAIADLAWTREGNIVYTSNASGTSEIWQIGADGTGRRRLTENSGLAFSIASSPTDGRLAFSAVENGTIEIRVADAAGRDVRKITSGSTDTWPTFTPDGRSIVFQRGSTVANIWLTDADIAGAATQLTGYYSMRPALSPDGKLLAFHFIDYGDNGPHWKLGIIETASRRLVTKLDFPEPIVERRTAWHPSGKFLTLVATAHGKSGLILISPTDGGSQKIGNVANGAISAFAWSPDGSQLAFTRFDETSDLVTIK